MPRFGDEERNSNTAPEVCHHICQWQSIHQSETERCANIQSGAEIGRNRRAVPLCARARALVLLSSYVVRTEQVQPGPEHRKTTQQPDKFDTKACQRNRQRPRDPNTDRQTDRHTRLRLKACFMQHD